LWRAVKCWAFSFSLFPILFASPHMTISVVSPISTGRGQHNKAAPFWYGGAASCVATLVSHPFDLTKVRLQTVKGSSASGMLTTMVYIVRNEGILGVYNGLSASLLRQGTYSTVRFGLYDQFKAWVAKDESKWRFNSIEN
jgi:solute carrier family 25 (mitochondrial dicarboxylate transporter), member 10